MKLLTKALLVLVLVGSALGGSAGAASADTLLPALPLGPGVCC